MPARVGDIIISRASDRLWNGREYIGSDAVGIFTEDPSYCLVLSVIETPEWRYNKIIKHVTYYTVLTASARVALCWDNWTSSS